MRVALTKNTKFPCSCVDVGDGKLRIAVIPDHRLVFDALNRYSGDLFQQDTMQNAHGQGFPIRRVIFVDQA